MDSGADFERRIHALEDKYLSRRLRISHREHQTRDFVRSTVATLLGHKELLIATVKLVT